MEMLRKFLVTVCDCAATFRLEDRQEGCIREVREAASTRAQGTKVLMLLSGGVDSTVCCALLHKALNKDQVRLKILRMVRTMRMLSGDSGAHRPRPHEEERVCRRD